MASRPSFTRTWETEVRTDEGPIALPERPRVACRQHGVAAARWASSLRRGRSSPLKRTGTTEYVCHWRSQWHTFSTRLLGSVRRCEQPRRMIAKGPLYY